MSNLDNSCNNLLTKKRKQLFKKGLLFFLSFCFIYINISFFSVNFARASWYTSLFGDDWSGEVGGGQPSTMEILTNDMEARFNTLKSWLATVQGFVDEADRWLNKQYGARIYKAALHYFLNTLAHDTAVYLASGGKGQQPMFVTESWGKYLSNIADDAAGLIIEDLGKQGAYKIKFNLCEPDFAVKLKINLGLVQAVKPNKPACSFSKMIKNWDQELKNPDFLSKFQDMFNPYSNDLGIALTVQTGMEQEISKKVNEAAQERIANKGWLSVQEPISGNEKTPASLVQKSGEKAVDDSTAAEKVYTENYVADAINIFINTLAGKFFDQLLKNGLVTSFPEHKSWDYSKDAQGSKNGGSLADTKDRFKNLIEPSFGTRGDYNILMELTMCSDPTKAGPTNCVITENFRQAIETRMTVGQAMKEGFLNATGVFGYTADGLEPAYNEGYPYRSMPILRKFRIIPVGWEIAAQYIKDYAGKTYNLGDLVACYDSSDDYVGLDESWCHGLVDPSWVLKAPLNYCKREGAGPEIISDQVMGEGNASQRVVARNDKYCGDEQSCIKENDDGSCQLYGYCAEERRKWQFNGKSCEPKYNTCMTFKAEDGSTVSYLENTLDYGNCNADNAGCKAYCADYDFANGKWTCTASTGDKIHLDKNAEACDEDAEGCSEVIRTKAGLGANLLKNSSFENYTGTVDDAAGDSFDQWGGIGEAVSDSFDAATAVKLSGNLSNTINVAPADYSIGGEVYSFSFYAKNCTDGDTYNIEGQAAQEISASADWAPYQTAYTFPKDVIGNQVTIKINSSSCVIDAIKLERGQAGAYYDYRGAGLGYLKVAPDYLDCDKETTTKTDIANWTFRESYDEIQKKDCGQGGTRRDDPSGAYLDVNGGEWMLSSDGHAYGFGITDTATDGAGGNYDGMLISDSFTIPAGAKDMHIWRNVIMKSFDNIDNVPDSYYLEMRDANNPNYSANVLATIESWESPASSENKTITGEISYDISALVGKKVFISFQIVGHDGNVSCNDGGVDDAIAQIGDVYFTATGSANSGCSKFAKKCQADEVGCDLYTSTSDDSQIPAKALKQDYCAAECVGYDAYIQGESSFDSLRSAYFIPKTAKTCGSSAAGCDQFTNLDAVKSGGEGIEYYSDLRQCIKPDEPGANCGEFYTWEGSEETGYQLRVFKLQTDDDGDDAGYPDAEARYAKDPAVKEYDYAVCSKDIYKLSPLDPAYNPDCREFYNKAGEVSYHLYTKTITCSADCHPYRRTENNADSNITGAIGCSSAGSGYAGVADNQFHWDAGTGECIFCKNGGEWNDEQNACVYMAIPDQGAKCSANENGCREYRGNAGNNVQVVSFSDFEGSAQNWVGVNTAVSLSSNALISGGNSLYVSNGSFTAALKIGEMVEQGKPYILSFIAKSAGAGTISSIKLVNGDAEEAAFSADNLNLGADWSAYKASLSDLVHKADADEELIITGNGAFYIDDIKLTEITDVYYLIKDSWITPEACYYDTDGNYVGPYVNAGCDQYSDRDNNTHYLHQFSKLCSDSAVGCELMINTHNSKDYNAQTFNAGDPSEVTVPADSYDYIVYDQNKKCGQEDKGCQLLGNPTVYGNTTLYEDAYLKNDPDKYDTIMCKADEIFCGEWTSTDGTVYFKDPGNMACEWRQKTGQGSGGWGWYKVKVMRCDNNKDDKIGAGETQVCLSSSNCASGVKCINDDNDYACSISGLKTLGIGGVGNSVLQPTFGVDGDWVGLCPAAQSGCSEYIEPVSRFMPNMLFNGEFSQDVDNNTLADGWTAKINGEQDRMLEANTLYILAVEGNNTAVLNGNNFYELDNNNRLTGPLNQITVSSSIGLRASKRFYAVTSASIKIQAADASSNNNSAIELKQAIMDYKLKQDLDESSCNGIVDFEQGCVLFNKRAQNGNNLEAMKWDGDLTVDDGIGISPQAGADVDKDANILLKVSPDRVCDKWLACRSYIKDENNNNVCFDIGTCDGVDDNGNCSSFVVTKKQNQTYPLGDIGKIANLAGYTIAGVDWGANKIEGDFPAGEMEQEGQTANVSNSGFEFYGSNGYPIGWNYVGATDWDVNVFSVVNNPFSAQIEGIGFAPEGSSFLKLGSEYSATSEYINVASDMDYILTAYINTKNLPGASAAARIEQFNVNSGSLGAADVFSLSGSNDWTYKLGSFKTNPNAAKIKITLHSQAGATGNFYFDDVKIRPALYSKDNNGNPGNPWYTSQTCRLYPKSDSLSCEYYDDSGIINSGWYGYCLQYDRYPGSRDACVLWWPTDKVKGEGIEEGAGYLGKVPVYYCSEVTGELVNPAAFNWESVTREWGGTGTDANGPYNIFYLDQDAHGDLSGNFLLNYSKQVIPGRNYEIRNQTGRDKQPKIIESNSDQLVIWMKDDGFGEGAYSFELWDTALNQKVVDWTGNVDINLFIVFTKINFYCNEIVQTVNSVGDNKYWSSRVYEGSNYSIPDLGYIYTTDSSPFGSMKTSNFSGNPYEWDGNLNKEDGIQPITPYIADNIAVNPYSCSLIINGNNICDDAGWLFGMNPVGISTENEAIDRLKRIFAQSYGVYKWDEDISHYKQIGGDWSLPQTKCDSEPRPAYPNDFCGLPPKIKNLKVNGQTGNLEITNNQFINFTFNTEVDSQQLPLVAYAIDWGDNEKTAVTGVEMRDRANPDNPHSMYHLYSYWDLKAKNATAQDENSVYCGNAGAEAKNYSNAGSGYDCPAGSACCAVKPSAKVRDNWGWCQDGISGNPCQEGYQDYGGWIVVKEK